MFVKMQVSNVQLTQNAKFFCNNENFFDQGISNVLQCFTVLKIGFDSKNLSKEKTIQTFKVDTHPGQDHRSTICWNMNHDVSNFFYDYSEPLVINFNQIWIVFCLGEDA